MGQVDTVTIEIGLGIRIWRILMNQINQNANSWTRKRKRPLLRYDMLCFRRNEGW
jgi:hypothetical protein